MHKIEGNDICRLNTSFGPFSSGTLVRVLELDDDSIKVKLLSSPDDLYLKNLKAHGINEDGVFEIPRKNLTRRRYQVGSVS